MIVYADITQGSRCIHINQAGLRCGPIHHVSQAIINSPLQTYESALAFSPACSRTRGLFEDEEPEVDHDKTGYGR
jgi:hypothetical protein